MRPIADTEVITSVSYTADGTTATYVIPFEYLSRSHVYVTVDGNITAFAFGTACTAILSQPPLAGSKIKVYRQTPFDHPQVMWTDGTVLTADDLNTQLKQVLFVLQENQEALEGALAYDPLLDAYDALNHHITNLADPTKPQDAVTYKIFQQEITVLREDVAEALKTAYGAVEDAKKYAEEARKHAQDYIPYSFGRFRIDENGDLVAEYYGDPDGDDIKFDEDGNIIIYLNNSPKINVGRGRIVFKGDYDAATAYKFYDCVKYNGSWWLYIGNEPSTNIPVESDLWTLFGAKGDVGPQGPQGEKGETGRAFKISGYYPDLAALQTAVTAPEIGDVYGVGATAPYNIFIWDGTEWVDNDTIQGLQGPQGVQGPQGASIIGASFDANGNLILTTNG